MIDGDQPKGLASDTTVDRTKERAIFRFRYQRCIRRAPNLKPLDKLIGIALADYMNNETGECFPSQELLAVEHGVSTRAVAESISALRRNSWLSTHRPTRHSTNRYFLLDTHLEAVEELYDQQKTQLQEERDMKQASPRRRV